LLPSFRLLLGHKLTTKPIS